MDETDQYLSEYIFIYIQDKCFIRNSSINIILRALILKYLYDSKVNEASIIQNWFLNLLAQHFRKF